MRTNVGLRCSLAVVAAVAATNRAPRTPKQIDVQFRFQENVVTLHEPVVLLFEVHSGLKQPITLTVGALTRPFYDLTLTTPSGQVLDKAPSNTQVDIVTIGDSKNRHKLTSEIETAGGELSNREPSRSAIDNCEGLHATQQNLRRP